MKKILFSILAGGLILVGCSKDGGGSVSITGTWNVNSIVTQTYLNGALQGNDTTTAGSFQFADNGDFISTDDTGDTTNGTYTYNSSSKVLTVISDSDTTNVNVTNLTANNLHFTEDETESVGGFTVRIVSDADLSR